MERIRQNSSLVWLLTFKTKKVSCSPDPTTNAETTNPKFQEFLINWTSLTSFVYFLYFCRQKRCDWFRKFVKLRIRNFGIGCLICWTKIIYQSEITYVFAIVTWIFPAFLFGFLLSMFWSWLCQCRRYSFRGFLLNFDFSFHFLNGQFSRLLCLGKVVTE